MFDSTCVMCCRPASCIFRGIQVPDLKTFRDINTFDHFRKILNLHVLGPWNKHDRREVQNMHVLSTAIFFFEKKGQQYITNHGCRVPAMCPKPLHRQVIPKAFDIDCLYPLRATLQIRDVHSMAKQIAEGSGPAPVVLCKQTFCPSPDRRHLSLAIVSQRHRPAQTALATTHRYRVRRIVLAQPRCRHPQSPSMHRRLQWHCRPTTP
jgi:hypothetical protein